MPDDTQDVPQGVFTGALLAGERAEEESVQKPGRHRCRHSAFFRIIVLPDYRTGGRREPGPQATLRNAAALTVLGQSKLNSDSIFPLAFYTRI